MSILGADPVEVVEQLGMDVFDVATNFVGILAMSQVINSIHSPMDIYHEIMAHAPDARLSFLVAAFQGMQEAEVMAITRPLAGHSSSRSSTVARITRKYQAAR